LKNNKNIYTIIDISYCTLFIALKIVVLGSKRKIRGGTRMKTSKKVKCKDIENKVIKEEGLVNFLRKTNKKGITLIALVVTIIVILILAAISIMVLTGENGLINKAKKAQEENVIGQEKEQISLAYNAAMIDKLGENVEKEDLQKQLDIIAGEGKTKVGKDKDIVVLYVDSKRMYVLDDNGKIKDNEEEVTGEPQIGDYVFYDPVTGAKKTKYESKKEKNGWSNQTFNLTGNNASYDTSKYGWRILGKDESGKILITSESCLKGGFVLDGQEGYDNGKEELDQICKLYGQGFGAIGARSIDVEDINKITGYSEINKELYGIGQVEEYGNDVTYYWDGTKNPYYMASNGTNGKMAEHYKFTFFDKDLKIWKNIRKSDTATPNNMELITTIKNNGYSYYPTTLSEEENGEIKGIDKNSVEYGLLFKDSDGEMFRYWLNDESQGCFRGDFYAYFGHRQISEGMCYSTGTTFSDDFASGDFAPFVRPVITLDASFVGSSETGWKIKEPSKDESNPEIETDKPTREDFFIFDSSTGMITGVVEDKTEDFSGVGWHTEEGKNGRISSETTIVIPNEINGITVKRHFWIYRIG